MDDKLPVEIDMFTEEEAREAMDNRIKESVKNIPNMIPDFSASGSMSLEALDNMAKYLKEANATFDPKVSPFQIGVIDKNYIGPVVIDSLAATTPCFSASAQQVFAQGFSTVKNKIMGGVYVVDDIQAVDIKCTLSEFDSVCKNFINGNYDFVPQMTKQGKSLVELKFTNDSQENTSLLMEQDPITKDLIISPFQLHSTNYFKYFCEELFNVLERLAIDKKGTFIGSAENQIAMIINGKANKCKMGIVSQDDTVKIDLESDNKPKFTVKKALKEFIKEEDALKVQLKGIKDQIEILNTIAKYVLNRRMNNDMELEDFLDIFRQCCLLGANNPTVLNFYKIVKM